MAAFQPAAPGRRNPRRRWVLAAGLFLVLVLGGVCVRTWLRKTPPPALDRPKLPAAALTSRFRNTLTEVKYVGDHACVGCHGALARTYRQHPMGRSFAPVTQDLTLDSLTPASAGSLQAAGFDLRVKRRDGKLFHQEIYRDSQGKAVYDVEAEIQYLLGSGHQGYSCLVNRDGYLFQSPLSWFSEKSIWDLAPGYARYFQHFERPITGLCLFCHANQVHPVADTLNRFREPLFEGYAIGCERCHGPGELHVASRQRGDSPEGIDDTIVNPRHLKPALREGVCQQCHLQGEARILRRGRHEFDYRPGLPFHLVWSEFVRRPDLADPNKSVSHVEQMYSSRCFRQSKGTMGCISCHDPHALPAPEKRVTYYRDRCLACHKEQSCRLEIAVRREKALGDSCIACHMPRAATSDIAHAAATDHRVVRRPDRPPPPPLGLPANNLPILHFHRDLIQPGDREPSRGLGLALMQKADRTAAGAEQVQLAAAALPLLERARDDETADVPVWEAEGIALWMMGRREEAIAATQHALELAPRRETVLRNAAIFSRELGRQEISVAYYRRLLEVNPWHAPAHYQVGEHLARERRSREAVQECRTALAIHPGSYEPQMLLVTCFLELGDRSAARVEFARLLALKPPRPDELRRWFTDQVEKRFPARGGREPPGGDTRTGG